MTRINKRKLDEKNEVSDFACQTILMQTNFSMINIYTYFKNLVQTVACKHTDENRKEFFLS